MAPAAPKPVGSRSPQSSRWGPVIAQLGWCVHQGRVAHSYPPQEFFLASPIVRIVYSAPTSPPILCFDPKSSFHLVSTVFSTILIPAHLSELKY